MRSPAFTVYRYKKHRYSVISQADGIYQLVSFLMGNARSRAKSEDMTERLSAVVSVEMPTKNAPPKYLLVDRQGNMADITSLVQEAHDAPEESETYPKGYRHDPVPFGSYKGGRWEHRRCRSWYKNCRNSNIPEFARYVRCKARIAVPANTWDMAEKYRCTSKCWKDQTKRKHQWK